MFVDTAKIYVKGGDGGDGMIAFRREKYVPDGGPAGGDGGRGADIIFEVDEGLNTLMDFKYQRHFKAQPGEKGMNKSRNGSNADPMIVKVPPGTVIIDEDSNEIIGDMVRQGQQVVAARGGRGGKGNVRFATAKNPAPELAEHGQDGEERWITLELKLMADAGLVGFPSVGKSTLLSVVSAAKPKIGAYHFTTISPNLGVVSAGEGRNFVLADLPGLIEGAHEGTGLGLQFLRHVERTRLIVHVIDMAGTEGRDPYEDWHKINEELRLYSEALAELPQIIAANKMDMPDAETGLELFREQLDQEGLDTAIYPIAAASHQGLKELIYGIADRLDKLEKPVAAEAVPETDERKIYRFADKRKQDDVKIHRENDTFVIESPTIEDLLKRLQFGSYDAMMRFASIMRKMGVDRKLREMGAEDGHMVRIGELEFEFVEHGME